MPRKPAPAQPSPKSRQPPAAAAVGQMAKLASAGAGPDRMATAVAGILEEWLAEGLDESDMRERLEQLQADLDGGVDNVENAEADADTDGQRKAAAAQKAALVAARHAVNQALERLGR